MALLVWVPELDTGITEIDRQHRRIVDYINKLYELRASPDRDGLGHVIAEMVDYTESHFTFEEDMLENAGYAFLGPHKKVHELFIRRIASLQARFEVGEDVTGELHDMLSRWLFNHIRHEDHSYVEIAKAHLESSQATAETERQSFQAMVHKSTKKRSWLARLMDW